MYVRMYVCMYVCMNVLHIVYVHKVEISVLNEIQTNCFSKITKYFVFFLFSKVLTNKNSIYVYYTYHITIKHTYVHIYIDMYVHMYIQTYMYVHNHIESIFKYLCIRFEIMIFKFQR